MSFLALVLGFVGYTLVYGATANHGRFATAPWTGVLLDAYDGGSSNIPPDAQPPSQQRH